MSWRSSVVLAGTREACDRRRRSAIASARSVRRSIGRVLRRIHHHDISASAPPPAMPISGERADELVDEVAEVVDRRGDRERPAVAERDRRVAILRSVRRLGVGHLGAGAGEVGDAAPGRAAGRDRRAGRTWRAPWPSAARRAGRRRSSRPPSPARPSALGRRRERPRRGPRAGRRAAGRRCGRAARSSRPGWPRTRRRGTSRAWRPGSRGSASCAGAPGQSSGARSV